MAERDSSDTLTPSLTRSSVRSNEGGFSSFKSRMERALSPGREKSSGPSLLRSMSEERRGRDTLISTGRGGAGNHVRSVSRGPDESIGNERGRELREQSTERATHSGRGGAGNIRSPSRDPKRDKIEEAQESALQEKLIAERRGRDAEAPFSSGRGGAGNILGANSRSRSRSAARGEGSPAPSPANGRSTSQTRSRAHDSIDHPRPFQNSGRGGYGNITEEITEEDLNRREQQQLYEAEVKRKYEAAEGNAPRNVGRGGAGNSGHTFEPVDISKLSIEERDAHAKVAAGERHVTRGGRGGAGNIIDKDRGRETGGGGVIGSMLRSLSRATKGERAQSPATRT